MRFFNTLLLLILLLAKGGSVENQVKQPTLKQARALSSSFIYLSWVGPIDHPGGFKYRIYFKVDSMTFQNQIDIPGSRKHFFLHNLKEDSRYTICVAVVDKHYQTGSACDNVAIITTPAQKGYVSIADRKYLTKGGFYQGARHYWPFDYESQLRCIKYSLSGKAIGKGVSIEGKGRGYLRVNGPKSWVRLGKFTGECLCEARLCRIGGLSFAFWVKLSVLDNGTKVLLGTENLKSKNTGVTVLQTVRNGTWYINGIVFMDQKKWKSRIPVKPGKWIHITMTWKEATGLRIYKNGRFMSERNISKSKQVPDNAEARCTLGLSPPSKEGILQGATYDDLVVWNYELSSTNVTDVYNNSIDVPKLKNCTTFDGVSLDLDIYDKDNVYELEGGYRISWKRVGDDDSQLHNYTSDLSFHIGGLQLSTEYVIEIQRIIYKDVFSRSSSITCSTIMEVPSKPGKFEVVEEAPDYFLLKWQEPVKTFNTVGYKISYRVDDFASREWTLVFLTDVTHHNLDNLSPYTDYIVKLLCYNEDGDGPEATLKATTAQSVPDAPRVLKAVNRGYSIYIRWTNCLNPRGIIKYKVIASVRGNETIVFRGAKVFHRIDNVDQNTSYTFWVVTYNVNNDSRYESKRSNSVTVHTPSFTPSVPGAVATNVVSSGVNISWNRSDTHQDGLIEYKLLGIVNGQITEFCRNCGLSYLFKNPSLSNSPYTFWVVAYNVKKGYESPPSTKVNISSSLFVPNTPGSFNVSLTIHGLYFSWTKSEVAVGDVEYKLLSKNNGTTQVFCLKCGLGHTIANLEPNMKYSIYVVAYNVINGLESNPSSMFYMYSPPLEPPLPEKMVVLHTGHSSTTVSWQPPEGIRQDKANIWYKVTIYNSRQVVKTEITQNLQMKFTNLTQFSRYYVSVQMSLGDSFGPQSAPLVIQTKDEDECATKESPCTKHATCINSEGSFFCTCLPGYVGNGLKCEALPSGIATNDFCPEQRSRNILWKKTYRGHYDKNLCPNGTIGISTRECVETNGSTPYWSDPNLSNCVSAWMAELDDKFADPSLNSTAIGDFFLNLLKENDKKGLYGGDVIKSVEVIDNLYNNSKNNELDQQQPNPESATTFVKKVINITEKMLEPKNLNVWKDIPRDRRTENGAQITQTLEDVVVQSAKLVNYSLIENEHIAVWYGDLDNLGSTGNETLVENKFEELNSITIPKSFQRRRKDIPGKTSVAIIKYKTIGEILAVKNTKLSKKKEFVNAPVLSVTMDPPLPAPFQEPFEFILKNQKAGQFDNPKCVFFNTSNYPGAWSQNGCIVFNVTTNYTVCHCYHMTSFSVLMQVRDNPLSNSDALILNWITRIGLSISLIALGLAFLTFLCLPRPCGYRNASKCFKLCEQGYRPTYLKKVRSSIHANLILSLGLGETLFLWGIERTGNNIACYTIAALLHYLLLVAFFWMAAEGVILYLVLVKVFQRKSSKKDKRMFMVICWGTPAAIVCISLAVGYENYLHERCCWLSLTHGLIWSFVGPALLIIMVNMFFLFCTFRVMAKRSHKWKNDEKKMAKKIRYWAKGAGIVTCLLGITWIFGIFYVDKDAVVVAYLFNICNALQGLFIFIFHCLLDKKIRQQYYQVFCAGAQESRSPSQSTVTNKKERRRGSTFNSWLWSVVPMRYQDSKSESGPTVAENTLKRLTNSTPSLVHSTCGDPRLNNLKLDENRLRNNSSIYHDSDENMDNIPDKIFTVKHSKPHSEQCDEDSSLGDYWISTLTRENSHQFIEIPETNCGDCLYGIREWEEAQKVQKKTNSWHELQLKNRNDPNPQGLYFGNPQESSTCSSSEHSIDEPEEQALLDSKNYNKPSPLLSDCQKHQPQYYQMLQMKDSNGEKTGLRKKVPLPVSV